MGNDIDSRAQNDWGILYVKTSKPFYYQGDMVEGKIYIRVDQTIQPSQMEIRIKGKEACSWYYTKTKREDDLVEGEEHQTSTEREKKK